MSVPHPDDFMTAHSLPPPRFDMGHSSGWEYSCIFFLAYSKMSPRSYKNFP